MPTPAFIATPYAITSAISALLSLGVAVLTSPKLRRHGGVYISLLLYSLAIWSGFASLEYAATNLAVKFTFVQLQYLGVVTAPVLFLLGTWEMIRQNHGSRSGISTQWVAALFAIPAITFALALTNQAHHLLWTSIQLDPTHNTTVLGHGPWYWVGTVGYSYLVFAFGAVFLISSALASLQPYRSQAILLFLSALIPVVGNILYVLDYAPIPGYDPVASLISVSAILFAINYFRYHIMELPPLELGQVLDGLSQAVIVTDSAERLVYINQPAQNLLVQAGSLLFRLPGPLPARPGQPLHLASQFRTDYFSFSLQPSVGTRHYHAQRSAFAGKANRGTILLISDITAEYESNLLRQQALLHHERDTLIQTLDGDLADLLGSIHANLSRVQQDLRQGNHTSAQTQIDTLLVAANNADREMRLTIFNILARGQAGAGISGLLQEYTRRVSEIYNLPVSLSLPATSLDGQLSAENASMLLATLQELLNHAVTDGNATRAQIMLTQQYGQIACIYTDDCAHQSPAMAEALKNRAAISNAVADLGHQPGGTQMLLTIPASPPLHSLGKLRVLLADQQTLSAEALLQSLGNHGATALGNVTNPAQVAPQAAHNQAQIVLLSSRWSTSRLQQLLADLASQAPAAKAVLLADEPTNELLRQCLQSGVAGILLKDQSLPEVVMALAAIQQGNRYYAPAIAARLAGLLQQPSPDLHQQAVRSLLSAGLSEKQIEVLQQVAKGKVYKQIASELSLSESAIKYHMERMLEVTGMENRASLIQYAFQIGLIEDRRN